MKNMLSVKTLDGWLLLLLITMVSASQIMAASPKLVYNRSRDTTMDMLLVSPGERVVTRPGSPLIFDILVFNSEVDSVTVFLCGVPFKIPLIDEGPPYRYKLSLEIAEPGLYSWIIVLHYRDGSTRNSCIGRTLVIWEEGPQSIGDREDIYLGKRYSPLLHSSSYGFIF